HYSKRSGPDRSRGFADANGSLSGDDIDDFVTAFMDMLRDSFPHLQHADGLQWIARQNRFLERFTPDEVFVEIIDNRHGHGPTAGRDRCGRRWLGSGWLGGRWWSGVQHDVDLAVCASTNRKLPLERDESLTLAAQAVHAVLQVRNDGRPCASRDELSRSVAGQHETNVAQAHSVLILHGDSPRSRSRGGGWFPRRPSRRRLGRFIRHRPDEGKNHRGHKCSDHADALHATKSTQSARRNDAGSRTLSDILRHAVSPGKHSSM